jgi:hypothetical protein
VGGEMMTAVKDNLLVRAVDECILGGY